MHRVGVMNTLLGLQNQNSALLEATPTIILRQTWDLGPTAAMLQCLHLDTPFLEQENTKKLYGTKNNCKFWTTKIQRPKNPNATFGEPETQTGS